MLKYIRKYNNYDDYMTDGGHNMIDDDAPFVSLTDLNMVTYSPVKIIESNGWTYVDLGLPSKMLWSAGDMSGYYAWGHTNVYYSGNPSYNYWDGTSFTKYCRNDYKYELDLGDDAAYIWRYGDWKTPTINDFYELIEYTTQTVEDDCVILTSTVNGETLEFPFLSPGWYAQGTGVESTSEIWRWTNSVDSSNNFSSAWAFDIVSGVQGQKARLDYALPVRPVLPGARRVYNMPYIPATPK